MNKNSKLHLIIFGYFLSLVHVITLSIIIIGSYFGDGILIIDTNIYGEMVIEIIIFVLMLPFILIGAYLLAMLFCQNVKMSK